MYLIFNLNENIESEICIMIYFYHFQTKTQITNYTN